MNVYLPMKHNLATSFGRRYPFLSARNDINELFRGLISSPRNISTEFCDTQVLSPKLDIVEHDTHFELSAEVPGLTSEDIEISVEENVLSIKGELSSDTSEETDGKYYSERSFGSFERKIQLGESINTEDVKAKCKNGILTVELPKLEEQKPESRKIKVSSE